MDSDSSNDNTNNSTIMSRLAEGKFVLIAEIGVNYYDIATKEGITPMEAAIHSRWRTLTTGSSLPGSGPAPLSTASKKKTSNRRTYGTS